MKILYRTTKKFSVIPNNISAPLPYSLIGHTVALSVNLPCTSGWLSCPTSGGQYSHPMNRN